MSPPRATSGSEKRDARSSESGLRPRGTTATGSRGTRGSSAEARPRRRRSDGERSRDAILREATRLATLDGIEGLSLGRLAEAVGMSKSGLFAHFGSKEELQLATIEAASAIYDDVVIAPAQSSAPGVARLRAYTERFLAHVREGVFPGGCFFASAASELDTHPGRLRDLAMAVSNRWMGLLEAEVAAGQEAGEIDGSLDAAQLAFELDAYLFLANTLFVATADGKALRRAHDAVESRLAAARPSARPLRPPPTRSPRPPARSGRASA
jgi:AcrR family transcriptional regulator